MAPNSVGFGLILRIVACFEPVFGPGYFFFSYTNEPASLLIFCTQWGNIGKLIFQESHREASQILFEPPLAVNSDELPKYENLIRQECLGPS